MENILVSTTNTIKNALKQKRVRNILIGIYVLLIIGLSASARAEGMRIFPQPPKETMTVSNPELQQFVGEVVASVDGRTFLMNGDATYELKSKEDLTQFNGYMVSVTGVEIRHKVGPVYQLASVTPLQTDDSELAVAPVVIVYDVALAE